MGSSNKVADAEAKTSAKDPPRRAKVVRKDPEKRRQQNRQSQKTYREKQRLRIEELERRAGAAESTTTPSSSSTALQDASSGDKCKPTELFGDITDVIDPSVLQQPPTDLDPFDFDLSTLPPDVNHWLQDNQIALPRDNGNPPGLYFDCGCSSLHIRMPSSPFLLPIRPINLYINTLRVDVECTLDALLRNCLHLGIPKSLFCSDDSESLFYRPLVTAPDPSEYIPNEAAQLVASTRSMFRSLKYDLRPLDSQIVSSHHPYIDVLPFRDLRENLIRLSTEEVIDEDEFLHDFFNHVRCWGGVKGSQGGGTPWEGRSWEASEMFLRKWAVAVGGDDGELTRQSRWWRTMRGERVEEVA